MVARTLDVTIGTWNLAGRWTGQHEEALSKADCDVWLLTDVPWAAAMGGYQLHPTTELMGDQRAWAAVLARSSFTPRPWPEDPHPASAAVDINGITFCSSVLPWRACGRRRPWRGSTCATKTEAVTKELLAALPTGATVWGGTWNHALIGPEHIGSLSGREHIRNVVRQLQLQVPTTELPHRIEGVQSIEHVAVPTGASVTGARRMNMASNGPSLSDRDAYRVDVTLGPPSNQWNVYVLDVLGLGPDHVYVGQTWRSPELRRQQHAAGIKQARIFKKPGVTVGQLRPDLLPALPPLRRQDTALEAEAGVAATLRARGLTVYGGH